ncbi:methyltransferase, FxLD system [Streptacidiphilus sp. MAP5-52]|uniref:methyltransferase, FxLD system n=1 Tax=Streptacidiphilus sp. MAP5-52 TaxID=3156267 RepID=UPI003512AB6E
MTAPATTASAEDLRAAMVKELTRLQWVRTEPVAAAMGALPKETFLPGTDLPLAYSVQDTVPVKYDEGGRTLSSASAPWLVAYMLEQARLRPGDRALEIGGGVGVNAGYLGQLVGPRGRVVAVEIDADLVDGARTALAATGITNVEMRAGDGHFGAADQGPYGAVLVTAQATDLAAAWCEQTTAGGRIVVPLTLLGLSRCYTFERSGHHWTSSRQEVCGFVAMQGEGAHRSERIDLEGSARLRVTDTLPCPAEDIARLAALPPERAWSGVKVARNEPVITHLDQYLSTRLIPYLRYFGPARRTDEGGERLAWLPIGHSATVTHGTLAYVAMRELDERFHEFGVFAHGPKADTVADELCELIRVWDRDFRGGPDAVVRAFPAGTPDDELPEGRRVDRPETRFVITQPSR